MAVFESMEAMIGNTPCVKLSNFSKEMNMNGALYGKIESANPTGSAKDRAALFMLNEAEEQGLLKQGGTIVEPTSGNTGIALAAIGAVRGYRVVLTMPDTMSRERIALLTAYGAQVILTPGSEGMAGSIKKALEIKEETGAFMPGQFDNAANARAHEMTTGPEIFKEFGENIGAFVAGVGTGGTLTGTARYLKKHCPKIKIIAVEPASSPLLSGGKPGAHGLQGIGANFVPSILDTNLIDEIIPVKDEDAFAAAKRLVRTEGLLMGITAGAALHAAAQAEAIAEKELPIVALLPDSGTRYLSNGIYE